MRINWKKVKQILRLLGAIITTIAGTYAVQSCTPGLF